MSGPIAVQITRASIIAMDRPRSAQRTAFMERIRGSGFADRVRFHFDTDGPKLDQEAVLRPTPPDTHVCVCGPAGFIDFVTSTALAWGWPADAVHREYFGAAPIDTSGDGSFEVRIASSGKAFTVPADMSVVQALATHGIDVRCPANRVYAALA